jgi:hypothetical protein
MSFFERAIVFIMVAAVMALLVWITPVFWQPVSIFLAAVVVIATLICLAASGPRAYDRASFWN